jgi:hypothetical protein
MRLLSHILDAKKRASCLMHPLEFFAKFVRECFHLLIEQLAFLFRPTSNIALEFPIIDDQK